MFALYVANLLRAFRGNEFKGLVMEDVLSKSVYAGPVLGELFYIGLRIDPHHHGFPGRGLSQVFVRDVHLFQFGYPAKDKCNLDAGLPLNL